MNVCLKQREAKPQGSPASLIYPFRDVNLHPPTTHIC